jgi:hypothetical protein
LLYRQRILPVAACSINQGLEDLTMRIISAKIRKDGKAMVSFAFDSGRVINKLMTPEQYAEAVIKQVDAVPLSAEELRARSIGFGQPGYRG